MEGGGRRVRGLVSEGLGELLERNILHLPVFK